MRSITYFHMQPAWCCAGLQYKGRSHVQEFMCKVRGGVRMRCFQRRLCEHMQLDSWRGVVLAFATKVGVAVQYVNDMGRHAGGQAAKLLAKDA